jgi:ABC-type nitrate/sulfonate/bicarbonate transport system substrate-binding protein
VRNTVAALQLAYDFARQRQDESVAIMTKRFPEIKPEIAKAAFKRMFDTDIIPTTPIVETDAWQRAIDLRVEVGDLKQPSTMANYVDNTFADWAKANSRLK